MDASSIHIQHVGQLTPRHEYWLLVYDRCRHTQELTRAGLEDPERAVHEVRRHYTQCLSCRLEITNPPARTHAS